mmetsp:Transcript_13900/g.28683  ORF Transcript_13900/g.28683 Transcript_13900/m.28683 type:complete len:471 (+) Transcript_13900:120-1532(+)|eukprot:CAMPEP_0197265634 /NCGR_PEP_ID=MMETSP1432-20130617/2519_1 /TAXON_ID=44447 /ORGANISM="Pseudo-nitzschia delicatissima, Strain UNC1205" /LENGTH=470 /DNA_ID=CAMNT_0042730403 /DNA_START=56 /DNA_END=1468 /DNA_ORIENTATION=+
MSNPAADIGWLEEDSTPVATVATPKTITTPDVEDPGGTGWLVNDSPASRTSEKSSGKKKTKKKTKKKEKATNTAGVDYPVITVTPVQHSTAWLADDSPTTATPPPQQPTDDIIYAPSRAGEVNDELDANTGDKKKRKKKKKTENTGEFRTSKLIANINANTNVNTAGDNSTTNAVLASQKTWGQYVKESFERDGRLVLITIGVLIVMNIPFLGWAMYPFIIYSTWIHEMCHALAALMVGGSVSSLKIYPDGSGLAYVGLIRGGSMVFSAGYQGTAIVGFLLLIFRRTKRGPRTGTMILACAMLLSCLIWIRNVFGFIFMFCMGLVLAGLAWKLPSFHIRNLYVVLAVMCSLNAITHVRVLFGSSFVINGSEQQTSDAHMMGDITGTSYLLWATLWFILAIVMTILGIVFAIPGPDEVADFTCCGTCQDMGCFTLCNYPGQRWFDRMRGGNTTDEEENAATTTANSIGGEP